MDIDAARTFLGTNHRGVLVTYRADGRAQASPVLATLDEAGSLVVSTRETAYKVKNLRRDPRVLYCGLLDRFFDGFVTVEGEAELVSLPEAMDGLVAYYRSISGEHEDWDEYRAAMEREQRLLVRVPVERVGPKVAG